jgi:hypothetical protein
MDVAAFTDRLRRLSAEEIRVCAAALELEDRSVAEQVIRWRAELAIDCLVRRRCSRAEAQQARGAARTAARLVVDVARRRGIALPDADVTRVARVAGEIAQGLALGGVAVPFVQRLLTDFETGIIADTPSVLSAA